MLIRDPEADARMARSAGVADYWPMLLRYPLRGYCLPVIVMLSFFITIAMRSSMILPGGLPDTGLPLLVISLIWIVFYLIRVIDHTARGYATPPPMGGEALYLAGSLRALALPVMAAFAYFGLRPQQPTLAEFVLAASLFVLPAHYFILATEDRLAVALNPARWLGVIAVMGAAYLLPCALLVAGALLLGRVSGTVGTAVLVALCCYVLFGTAHVLGYVGFKRQHALGLQVDVRDPDEVEREAAHAAALAVLLRNLRHWQLERDEASAIRAIETHHGGPLDAIVFFEALFREVSTQAGAAVIHATGRRLVALLITARKPARALDIAEACLNSHWHFTPASPMQLEALLRQAISLKFDALYERLLKGAEADLHRAQPAWAGVQFLRALHQSESRGDDAGALALLAPLRAMTQHPQHALYERTARTLEALLARKRPA